MPLAASGTSVPGAGPPPVAGAPDGVPDADALAVEVALALALALLLALAEPDAVGLPVALALAEGVCDALLVAVGEAELPAAAPAVVAEAAAALGNARDATSSAAPAAAAIPAAAGTPADRVTVTDRTKAGPSSEQVLQAESQAPAG
jgi:hypothetical protein